MSEKGKGGRPRSARHILIFPRSDRPGFFLHIGLSLWEEIGSPPYITIHHDGARWRISPAAQGQHDYRVLRYQAHNTPFVPLGVIKAESLNLKAGVYPADSTDNSIVF